MTNSLSLSPKPRARPLYVRLAPLERAALTTCAERERRDPRDQAALLIAAQLEMLGLLTTTTPEAQPCPAV